MISSISPYFRNSEPSIIFFISITCYKYNTPIRNTLFNFNKLVSDLVQILSWHVVTGTLKIISDSRIRKLVSKGPKYRFPSYVDFNRCRDEIASEFN